MTAAGAAGAPILGGYTLVLRAGTSEVLGPYLVTPNQIPYPRRIEWFARVNGLEQTREIAGSELKITDATLRPGDLVRSGTLGSVKLNSGDVLEVGAEKLGVLRQQAR